METDRESRGRYWRGGHRRGHSPLALSFGRQKRTCPERRTGPTLEEITANN